MLINLLLLFINLTTRARAHVYAYGIHTHIRMESSSSMEYPYASCIRGHHVYKDIWSPYINEKLTCVMEEDNSHDPYAVSVKKGQIVGHLPRIISAACSLFMRRNGVMSATLTDGRQYSRDLPQGGLEVPCVLTFRGESKYVEKIKKLLPTQLLGGLEPASKKKKLSVVVVDDHDVGGTECSVDDVWVRFGNLILTVADRNVITEGKELTDKHIDFAQSLIKHQFTAETRIEGLISTLIFSNKNCVVFTAGFPIVQIIHTCGNHWIAATSDGLTNKVSVYDSIYSTIDASTKELIARNFGIDPIEFEVVLDAPKQKGIKDCGIFAIAICMSLADHYSNPWQRAVSLSLNQNVMRDHLIECYINKCMKLFP